jgi:hypothetical protein
MKLKLILDDGTEQEIRIMASAPGSLGVPCCARLDLTRAFTLAGNLEKGWWGIYEVKIWFADNRQIYGAYRKKDVPCLDHWILQTWHLNGVARRKRENGRLDLVYASEGNP